MLIFRRLFAVAALTFATCGTFAAPALAQQEEEAPATGGSSGGGSPYYGYIGTGFLIAGAIFVICKSARR